MSRHVMGDPVHRKSVRSSKLSADPILVRSDSSKSRLLVLVLLLPPNNEIQLTELVASPALMDSIVLTLDVCIHPPRGAGQCQVVLAKRQRLVHRRILAWTRKCGWQEWTNPQRH